VRASATIAGTTATSAPVNIVKVPRTVTLTLPTWVQYSDTLPVDVKVAAADGSPTAGQIVSVTAFGKTYAATVRSTGHASVSVAATTQPGPAVVTATTDADVRYATATASARTTVAAEDGQLRQVASSGKAGRATPVVVQLLDPTAVGYTGPRRESTASNGRGDVTKARMIVRVYDGTVLVGTWTPKLSSAPGGTGKASVSFTPLRRGTYTVVVSSGPGSWYSFGQLRGTVKVA
jgi:hypothetical protein